MLYHHAYLLTFYGHGDIASDRLKGVFEKISLYLLREIGGGSGDDVASSSQRKTLSDLQVLVAVEKVWSEYSSIVDSVKGIFLYLDVNYLPAKGKQPVSILGYDTFLNVLMYIYPLPLEKSLRAAMAIVEKCRRTQLGEEVCF